MSARVDKGRGSAPGISVEAAARGQRLRQARVAAGLEVHDMAALLGVRPQTVYRWEWGACTPHLDDCARIAAAYGIRAGWLVAGEPPARRKRDASAA